MLRRLDRQLEVRDYAPSLYMGLAAISSACGTSHVSVIPNTKVYVSPHQGLCPDWQATIITL
jgi:hypothetical protein